MFPTFTGSSRRPRQVNLSGRNSNPFAAVQQSPHARSQPNAIAQAQQERRARQLERQRLDAAQAIQKTWRGHASREAVRRQQRREWDERWQELGLDASGDVGWQQIGAEEVLGLLKPLLLFVSPRDRGDWERVGVFARLFSSIDAPSDSGARQLNPNLDDWTRSITRLLRIALAITSRIAAVLDLSSAPQTFLNLLDLLLLIVTRHTFAMDLYYSYYSTVVALLDAQGHAPPNALRPRILDLIYAPLWDPKSYPSGVWYAYTSRLMTFAEFADFRPPAGMEHHQRFVIEAMTRLTDPDAEHASEFPNLSKKQRRRLLSNFVNCYMESSPKGALPISTISFRISSEEAIKFMRIVYRLFSGAFETQMWESNVISQMEKDPAERDELLGDLKKLANSDVVARLLQRSFDFFSGKIKPDDGTDEAISVCSNYILLLFRAFPDSKERICAMLHNRMLDASGALGVTRDKVLAWHLWESFAKSAVFKRTVQGPKEAVEMMRADKGRQRLRDERLAEPVKRTQAWRVGLLFLELYSIALRMMDDDEFMYWVDRPAEPADEEGATSLDRSQITALSIFLKNLAFALYWFTSEIGIDESSREENLSLAQLFGNSSAPVEPPQPTSEAKESGPGFIAGLEWASLRYVKELATGVLRALYERE